MTSSREPTIETKRLYQGRIVAVREDVVRLASGKLAKREIVEHNPAVCIVPLDADGSVLMVRQYRKAVESLLLEAPAGVIEPGEEPREAALRELREEVGHTARRLEPLADFWLAPGYLTERMYAYLATELERSPLKPDDDEELEVVRVPLAEAVAKVLSGEIRDAKSIVSLLLAQRHMAPTTAPSAP